MSSLFIIGNGFDIAHGIPTSYTEFRKWLIDRYPDALSFRETTMTLDEYGELPIDEVAAETLVYAMDNATGEEWQDFEDALGRINFYKKLPGPTDEEHNEDDPKHNEKMGRYLLRIDMLSNAIIKSAEEYWPSFFSDWIKSIEERIEHNDFCARHNLIALFSDSNNKYMTFNYTKTLQILYGVHVVKHIHNRVGQKLIFGHGNCHAKYNEPFFDEGRAPVSSSFFDDFILAFQKDTSKQLRKYNDFFKRLDTSIDKIYSYGFSYSKVDNPYIKEVISRVSPNAIWYFTSYEAKNKEEIRKKKIKLRRYGFKGSFDYFDG